ncbi:MAG TPA: FecR domain-containing protein [Acidiferrobacterales bacterium]
MGSSGRLRLWLSLAPLLLLIAPAPGRADDGRCAEWVARVVSIQGPVEARLGEATAAWRPVALEARLCAGDTLRVQANGRAAIELRNETVVRLDQHTTLTLGAIETRKPSWLELLKGAAHFITRTPRSLEIKTPYVNAAVEGTEFQLRVTDADTRLWVYEGRVLAANTAGSQRVASGQALVARAGAAPEISLALQPQDAVRWTLYYPIVADFRPGEFAGEAGGWQRSTAASLEALDTGDAAGALERVLAVTQPVPDARFYTYRASLLLSVGRVDEARNDLQRARERDAGNAAALAVEAIIALARNDKDRAHDLARQAVAADAKSPAALLALSYAQQARFDLDAALASAQRAREPGPNAVADAQVAELLMATGEVGKAEDAARAAAGRSPASARAHSVLGFAYLADMRAARARAAFERAVTLDSADPLARLGLGLARIRDGELEEGRREIEIAAALDPANALVRSYLGKAYFEERRGRVAADQFSMAKQLDPKDPTPWLYDAFRKHADNRPVEALQDLDGSIERNDNRAVYRSQLLLDQDLAARTASQARIYDSLGFQQRALTEGWQSLAADPSNFSAHQFLADTYRGLRRHEVARASESLQYQLMQPISIAPVPPQLPEARNTVTDGAGPVGTAFNEFDPVFTRDRNTLRMTGAVGNQDTVADELVFAGLSGRVAYSIGQYYFSTEGFRDNNDIRQQAYNAFLQFALSGRSSLQLEVRTRDQRNGDLALRFDPDNFSDNRREDRKSDMARVGYRYSPGPRSHFIVSGIYNNTDLTRRFSEFLSPAGPAGPIAVDDTRADHEGYNVESQYIAGSGRHDHTLGVGYYRNDIDELATNIVTIGGAVVGGGTTSSLITEQHSNAYYYGVFHPARSIDVTVGMSVDVLKSTPIDEDQVNPKFGLNWQLDPATRLRLAAFRTLKRSLVSNQTIEPTQVAGFNQFFDDSLGTDARRYGIGVDRRFGGAWYAGAELSRRDLFIPFEAPAPVILFEEEYTDDLHRAYVYWTATNRLTFALEYFNEKFRRGLVANSSLNRPDFLRTQRVPLSVEYHWPIGYFARLTESYFNQDLVQPVVGGGSSEAGDNFWVTDVQFGYRLPDRTGIISIDIRNLTDKEFNFYDLDFQAGQPRSPIVQPSRSIMFKISLSLG